MGADTDELAGYLRFAEETMQAARRVILGRVARDRSHRLKADGSFVTDVDLAVEDVVRSRLQSTFPTHGVLGEERDAAAGTSEYEWIVDPIDGTHSFRHRIPLFGSLLALLRGGQPIVGVIDLPMLDRTYTAALGSGAYCNGHRLNLADVTPADVPYEVIATGERKQFVACGCDDAFDRLMREHAHVRTYCDCFGHALAIEGAVGAMIDYDLHMWDFAASEILMREAGGQFLRAKTDRSNRAGGHYDVIFGKPAVVRWVSEMVDFTDDRHSG